MMWCSNGKLHSRCVHLMASLLFLRCKTFWSFILIDVSVSDPLKCEMEEGFIIAAVTLEMFVLNIF